MQCIFCKCDSSKSKSIEHIIPESLGNKEYILHTGIVCDKCNHYFSLKIEKKLLEQPYFQSRRFWQAIVSKKGKYPSVKGMLFPSYGGQIEFHRTKDEEFQVIIGDDETKKAFLSLNRGSLLFPYYDMPEKNDKIISRFLGKVGLELVSSRALIVKDGLAEIIQKKELDLIRNYVRYGTPDVVWPYYLRRIYPEDHHFDENNENYQILHEMTLLYTEQCELYIVIAILGIEYCLNMGGPELDGYKQWLLEHNNKSPLDLEFCPNVDMSTIDKFLKKKVKFE